MYFIKGLSKVVQNNFYESFSIKPLSETVTMIWFRSREFQSEVAFAIKIRAFILVQYFWERTESYTALF